MEKTALTRPPPSAGWAALTPRLFLMTAFLIPAPRAGFAASSSPPLLLGQFGADAALTNGDYISDTTGMNTFYSFFIEVPPGLAQLQVDLYDYDVGAGGAAEANAG